MESSGASGGPFRDSVQLPPESALAGGLDARIAAVRTDSIV